MTRREQKATKVEFESPEQCSATVRDRLAALNQRYNELQTLGLSTQNVLVAMPDQDVIAYFERTRLVGEEAALRWVLSKYAPAPAGE